MKIESSCFSYRTLFKLHLCLLKTPAAFFKVECISCTLLTPQFSFWELLNTGVNFIFFLNDSLFNIHEMTFIFENV